MNNKELAGLLREANAYMRSIDRDFAKCLDDAANILEKSAQRIEDLQTNWRAAEEELIRFRNGYKGSCYACETVGEKNVELETKLAAAEDDAARYRWLIKNSNHGFTKRQRVVLYLPEDLIWNVDESFETAIDAAIQKEQQ